MCITENLYLSDALGIWECLHKLGNGDAWLEQDFGFLSDRYALKVVNGTDVVNIVRAAIDFRNSRYSNWREELPFWMFEGELLIEALLVGHNQAVVDLVKDLWKEMEAFRELQKVELL